MNTYYSELGRKLAGQTPIAKEGYYVLHEDERVSRSHTVPDGVPTITAERFVQELVDGCKIIIREFADSPENKDVYVFNLYTDEHYDVYVYMNTEERFSAKLAKYSDEDPRQISALKYNQGDFDFQFWDKHMGEHGQTVKLFDQTANLASYLDEEEDDHPNESEGKPVIAFEAGIIHTGYQVLALEAIQHLIAEDAFAALHRTDGFIAHAATGNDYVDYSIVMRKTIKPELFDALFPDIREKDEKYNQELELYRTLTVPEALDYWMGAVHDRYYNASPYCYTKCDYEVFAQLAPFGNSLADECLPRIRRLADQEAFSDEDWEKLIYYIECLHYSDELTTRQLVDCRSIAMVLEERGSQLEDPTDHRTLASKLLGFLKR